jgi:catechol 2,3-dioxygenase-like lactoylglutathione lyase family enzyme
MEAAFSFYRDLLGLDQIVYDVRGTFDDAPEGAEEEHFRRVLLSKSPNPKGAFSRLLGGIEIELVQCLSRTPKKIYGERFWGDPGFIHLCFDVLDMDGLKELSEKANFPFTIDSQNSFQMDKASGRYCYVEDPDGTLIELVETHKVPILKKFGWYMDLRKRKNKGPLADWKVQLLGLSKVK